MNIHEECLELYMKELRDNPELRNDAGFMADLWWERRKAYGVAPTVKEALLELQAKKRVRY